MTNEATLHMARQILAKQLVAAGHARTAEQFRRGKWDDYPEIPAVIEALETRLPMSEEEAQERALAAARAIYGQTLYLNDRDDLAVRAVKVALLNVHLPLKPKDEDVEMLRSRIEQPFMGKCYLTAEEAERIIARLEKGNTNEPG